MTVTISVGKGGVSGESVLAALKEARVFSVEKTGGGFWWFIEGCDGYFDAKLTNDQVLTLADELRALAGRQGETAVQYQIRTRGYRNEFEHRYPFAKGKWDVTTNGYKDSLLDFAFTGWISVCGWER